MVTKCASVTAAWLADAINCTLSMPGFAGIPAEPRARAVGHCTGRHRPLRDSTSPYGDVALAPLGGDALRHRLTQTLTIQAAIGTDAQPYVQTALGRQAIAQGRSGGAAFAYAAPPDSLCEFADVRCDVCPHESRLAPVACPKLAFGSIGRRFARWRTRPHGQGPVDAVLNFAAMLHLQEVDAGRTAQR